MKILVGSTGLIGTTLREQNNFDLCFNTSNIDQFESLVPEGSDLYLACLPAAMWMVNSDLLGDFRNMINVIDTLKKKKYSNVMLYSTIEVYNQSPFESDERHYPSFNKAIYGSNRYNFELLVKDQLSYDSLRIARLPALFGKNIKKNILFDLLNDNQVEKINTNSSYQWYNLDNIWCDTIRVMRGEHEIVNMFGEPIETEWLADLFGLKHNDLGRKEQNFKTCTTETGYWESRESLMKSIGNFIDTYRGMQH